MKNYIEQKHGQCGYCFKGWRVVRLCQLRYSYKDKWQEKLWICANCRSYLRGRFRYVKPKNFNKFSGLNIKERLKKELGETGKITPKLLADLQEYWKIQRQQRVQKRKDK